jgi:hypothetical protein
MPAPPAAPRAAEAVVRPVDGLEVLALVLGHARAGEAGGVGMRRQAAVDERRAAAVQASHEHEPLGQGPGHRTGAGSPTNRR